MPTQPPLARPSPVVPPAAVLQTATDVVPFSVLFSTVTFKDTAPVPFSLTFQNMGTFAGDGDGDGGGGGDMITADGLILSLCIPRHAGLVADPSVSPFRVSIAVDPSSPANTSISAAG